ncbi:MAG: homoserine kinase [Hyphomonadaceae bacterium]|nr:homoserine kinase [Hyphomonadaceae bacterium]
MAVYTDLTDDELATLLGAYDLGVARAFKGIAEGVENSNFYLETDAGRFILTIFEKRVAKDDLPFFMAVMERLAQKGFPAPQPMPTKGGALLGEVRGKACAIVTFLTGVSPRRPNVAQCRAIGVKIAEMHRALEGFAMTRANALSVDAWGAILRPRLALADSLSPGLAALIETDLAALEATWPTGLPRGIIHEDLFPDNSLFLGDEARGVIDFYFACEDMLALDVAVALNAWAFEPDRSFNLTKGQALIAGYESVRPLSAAERAALPTLARGAALRFLATRLRAWDDTPHGALVRPKDPLEYADKLAFHRRARSAADYGG